MNYLHLIIDKSQVEVNGKKVSVSTPTFKMKVEGEEEYTAEVVKFKPFNLQNKLVARDSAGEKVINETVYFEGVQKDVPIPDRLGGSACGRTFPSWEGVKSFDKEKQREQSKKATFYKHIFGEVTFPGKKPLVANLRLTPGIFMGSWRDVERQLDSKAALPSFMLKLEAEFLNEEEKYPSIKFSISDRGLPTEDNEDTIAEITKAIQDHNDYITSQGNS